MALTWEEIAQKVVVDGRPADVQSAALGWDALLRNLRVLRDNLKKEPKEMEAAGWKGDAYEAWRDHIVGLGIKVDELIRQIQDGEKDLPNALKDASANLVHAQSQIPIPMTLIDEIMAARNGHTKITNGIFEVTLRSEGVKLLTSSPLATVADWAKKVALDAEVEAQRIFEKLDGNYQDARDLAPAGGHNTPVDSGGNGELPGYSGAPGGGSLGGAPSIGGAGSPSLSGVGATPADFSGAPGTGYTPAGQEFGYDPTGTGLAGADPTSRLTGAGAGVGGLPTGSTGANVSGVSSSGGVPGGGSLGKPIGVGVGGVPLSGAGAARGGVGAGRGGGARGGRVGLGTGVPGAAMGPAGARGAGTARGTGRGSGGTGGGRGMLGGPLGHGGSLRGDADERTSWLTEDEDVWGIDGDATPPVLR